MELWFAMFSHAGVQFVSATGTGSYNSSTGDWTVGTLAAGQNASLTITVTVSANAGTSVSNTAEVTASSVADSDSTPSNAATSEDDFASVSFTASATRAAGTAADAQLSGGDIAVRLGQPGLDHRKHHWQFYADRYWQR
jgi:hypothetical protein